MKLSIFVLVLAMVLCAGVALGQYVTKIYQDNGGDRMVVDSGGTILANSGGAISMSRGARLALPSYTNQTLPTYSASTHNGTIVFCTNCAKGKPALVFGNGTAWQRGDFNSTKAPSAS